jgi:hypothetical protein
MEAPPTELRRARGAAAPLPLTAGAPADLRGLYDRAADIAFFILGDRAQAADVAVEALAKLRVAVRTQKRRRAYLPKGRSASGAAGRATRTRVSAEEGHLLQRLVYVESERWEREQERTGAVGAHALLLRYVKHLVRIGLKRNSFYVVLGLSRLLHRYSTIETMEIYALVIQDPDRVRDDHYYRSRKKQLLEEVLARFGDLLQLESGPRGEQRFRTSAADAETRAFVASCLRAFTPWDTDCVVPAGFDPWSDEIPALRFHGPDPDGEHAIETHRFHATIDPECYARLTAALALPAPAERLALPEFSMSNRGSSRDAGGGTSPSDGDDFRRAEQRLSEDAKRRKTSDARVLVIVADGAERARLDLDLSSHTRVRMPAATELVEVRGSRGEVLAVWLAGVAAPPLRSSAEYAVRLESGREIVILRERPDDLADFDLEITCRDAPAFASAGSRVARLWTRLLRALRAPGTPPIFATLAVAALVLTATVWRPWSPRVEAPETAPTEAPDSGLTRGGTGGATLATVRRIFVDPLGEGPEARALQESLATRVGASGRFERAARRSQAEAVLRGRRGAGGVVTLELMNARGDVLWRGTRAVPAGEEPAATAAALGDALIAAASRSATASPP